jgi:nitroreductase/NAD-dependent dihydropyrimidine dehydrogenase PreA subunit
MGFDLREKSVPVIDFATCTGCGRCVQVCGDQVLELEDGKPKAGDGVFLGCIGCGQCVAACSTGSIRVSGRGMTPDDRIELAPNFHRATADQFEALLKARRSIRKFTKDEIDRATIDRILEMTSAAPMGIPPSEVGVVVLLGPGRVQAFAEDACAEFGRMARFLNPVVLGLMRPFLGKEGHKAMRGFVRPLLQMLIWKRAVGEDWFTYDAPAAMLFHSGPTADPADCPIAATYAMLAAESLGLGTCLLGTTAALDRSKRFKKKYGIPPQNKIGLALVLGHPVLKFRYGVQRRLASVAFA